MLTITRTNVTTTSSKSNPMPSFQVFFNEKPEDTSWLKAVARFGKVPEAHWFAVGDNIPAFKAALTEHGLAIPGEKASTKSTKTTKKSSTKSTTKAQTETKSTSKLSDALKMLSDEDLLALIKDAKAELNSRI